MVARRKSVPDKGNVKEIAQRMSDQVTRARCCMVARALVTCPNTYRAAKKLTEETGVYWSSARVIAMMRYKETRDEVERLYRQQEHLAAHNMENLLEKYIIAADYDRTKLYEEKSVCRPLLDDRGYPIRRPDGEISVQWVTELVLKPVDQWDEEAKVLFDGLKHRSVAGQVLPEIQLVAKADAWEKLGKNLNAWKERCEGLIAGNGNTVINNTLVIPAYDPNDPESIRKAHEAVFGPTQGLSLLPPKETETVDV